MRSLSPTALDKELVTSINNAERHVKEKFYEDEVFHDFDLFFKAWLRSFWGITIDEPRLHETYSPDGEWTRLRYWPVQAVQSDERLVMFKLTFG